MSENEMRDFWIRAEDLRRKMELVRRLHERARENEMARQLMPPVVPQHEPEVLAAKVREGLR